MRPDWVERICRLTPLQDGMFFEALRNQDSGETIYQLCLQLDGPLSPSLLREAWRAVIRRHAPLRTSFHYERLDSPLQVVVPDADPPWRELDWRDVPEGEVEQRLSAYLTADRSELFELTRAPLLRLALARTAADSWWLVWSYHHLLLDGWSTYLVLDDVFGCYRELAAGRMPDLPAPRPFWEYVAWTQRQDLAAAERFWRERLAGVTAPTPLGAEDVGAAVTGTFDEVHVVLDEVVKDGLDALGRRGRLTPGTAVQASWALALSRYSGRGDVVFGSVVSGRPPRFSGVDDMVGLFINVLPVRAKVRPDDTLTQWLGGLQADLADGREYDFTPLGHVQRWSEVPSAMPLFESLVVYINYPVRPSWTDGGAVQVTDLRVLQQPHYPLHLTVVPDGHRLHLTLGYDPHRFRRETVERLVALVADLLRAVVADPERRIGELELGPIPLATTVPERAVTDLLTDQLRERPDAPALSGGGRRLSHRELHARAAGLARLLRPDDVAPGVIALRATDPVDQVVALLAALRVGGTVLLLDPSGDPGQVGDAAVFVVDEPVPATPCGPRAVRPSDATPDVTDSVGTSLRWALLGRDSDVTVLRDDTAAEAVRWMRDHFPLSPADRVAHPDPVTSADSVRDVLWALASGAELVLDPPGHTRCTVIVGPANRLGPCAPGTRLVLSRSPLSTSARQAWTAAGGVDLVEEYRTTDPLPRSTFWRAGAEDPVSAPCWGRPRDHARVVPFECGDPEQLWAVEAALATHPGIHDAAVLPGAADARPTAYVVPVTEPPDPADLADFLRCALPADLVPDAFVPVAEIPETTDGAVDRDALAASGRAEVADSDEERTTLAERMTAEVLTGIWTQIFDRQPGLRDNFFELGGHSLLAIKLVSRIRSALSVDIGLNDLFADPTVLGTVRAVRSALAAGVDPEPEGAIPRADRSGPLAVSFAQERQWILDRLGGAANLDNILLPFRVRGPLDLPAFQTALGALVERHEVLRTALREVDERPVQVVEDAVELPLRVDDLRDLPLPEAERRARALLEADAARRFDLTTAPMFTCRVLRLSDRDHVVGICLHHVLVDGWSTGVLFRDLTTVYRELFAGRAPALPPLRAQYADFATWQRDRLTGDRLSGLLEYWTEHLDGAPEVLTLRQSSVRPEERSYVGGRYDTDIPPDVLERLRELASQEGNTVFMTLFTVFGALVGRHADQDDVVIGVPVAARSHPDLEDLVGFFVNTLPVRLDLSGEPTFRELLQRTRRACLGALAHEDLPFEKLVSELRPNRSTARFPLVQVAFNFQNTPFSRPFFGDAEATLFETGHEVARFDLVAELIEVDSGVHCMFHYSADLLTLTFVRQFAGEYLDLVRRLVYGPDEAVFSIASSKDIPVDAHEVLERASLSRLRALQR